MQCPPPNANLDSGCQTLSIVTEDKGCRNLSEVAPDRLCWPSNGCVVVFLSTVVFTQLRCYAMQTNVLSI